ncbi:hypothetical protein B4135_1036 [Caldibacillus debilis]|uniref:Uncharacterized protein n=1 Tax=Caldibacillus debilis TaxID=301148 RepID=A0A150MF37_9BACI|nr:hypothetical protein B4135_1036 [Caldibacillus debilis]
MEAIGILLVKGSFVLFALLNGNRPLGKIFPGQEADGAWQKLIWRDSS